VLPDSYLRFADLEASATEIRGFESSMIPGLLQSPDYMRAIIRAGNGIWWEPPTDELAERITFREDRQARTWNTATPRKFHFVIAEEALRANVGGPDVMRTQLRHILDLLADRDDLTIQVLPQDTPSNPAIGGAFLLFDFPGGAPPVGVSFVLFGSDQYFDEPAETESFRRAFERLSAELALGPAESVKLLRALVTN
jgi:hypothetical protein